MRVALSLAWASLLIAGSLACSSTPESNAPPAPALAAAAAPAEPALGALARGEPEGPLAVEADDIARGEAGAQVTVVAFLDFECGFCAQGFQTLRQLASRYPKEELRIVMKHLPLDFHPQALPAAVAAQAVTLARGPAVGFDYAGRLFDSRSELDYALYADLASEVGVPRDVYNRGVSEEMTVKRVASDVVLARRHGVDGTPAFFVNGRLISGAQPIEVFIRLIDQEKAAMAAAGGDWASAYAARVRTNTQDSLVQALLERDPHDYRVPVDGSPVWGPSDAPLTLVEFSDFECPYCKRAEVTVNELKKLYAGKLRVVFKHKPLPFHKNARPAALLAALAQAKKGDAGFSAMAAALFEASPALDTNTLVALGKAQGLAENDIGTAIAGKDAALAARLTRDAYLADDVEVQGTPHFFINGKRLSGARPLNQFRALFDHELERARALLDAGTQPADLYESLQKDALSPGAPTPLDEPIPDAGRPSRGPAGGLVVHVFSDFQCPYCRQAEGVLHELELAHPGKLRFVWHDLPLDFHDHARPAALAGREAFAQKGNAGFWKMHDLLFSVRDGEPEGKAVALGRSDLEGYARSLGLDSKRFAAALDGKTHDAALAADKQLADSLGIRGTPAFVVGNYLVTGSRPREHFERLIELAQKH